MLSASVTKDRSVSVWLIMTVFCGLFAFVYELFSFGVYSSGMIFMFAYPLLLGVLPCIVLKGHMGRLWNDGVLLLTAASLLNGVFEIYGTTSTMTPHIRWLGIGCLAVGLLSRLRKRECQ